MAVGFVVVTMCMSCSSEAGSPVTPSEVTISDIASPTDPLVTAPPSSSADRDIPDFGEPQSEVVEIDIDASSSSPDQVSVPVGSPVNIRVRSASDEEFHLHGYDLELSGTDVLFTFTADRLGEFVLEAHGSGKELLILTVYQD